MPSIFHTAPFLTADAKRQDAQRRSGGYRNRDFARFLVETSLKSISRPDIGSFRHYMFLRPE
jgi:hypothetical protein